MSTNPEPPSTETLTIPNTGLDIQQLSLQMFMGKTQYKKYLAKSNPQSFQETQRNHAPYIAHETQIRDLMGEMLRAYVHPDTHVMPTGIDGDIVDAFTRFVDKAVHHYDKIRATNEYQLSDDDDDIGGLAPPTSSPYWGLTAPSKTPARAPRATPTSSPHRPAGDRRSPRRNCRVPITNTLDYWAKRTNNIDVDDDTMDE